TGAAWLEDASDRNLNVGSRRTDMDL
ncbi:hypothetical protein MGSAQ_002139, partial [marine sediment metagenome]